MPIPSWAVELLRRSVTDMASRTNPETIDRIRSQATAILNDLPAAAARTVDSVMSATETRREEVRQWAKHYTSKSREVVNATGLLIDPPQCCSADRGGTLAIGTAVDADVLEAGMEFFDGSRIAGPGLANWSESVLPKLTGGVSIGEPLAMEITNRFVSAVALIPTLSTLPLVLHRSEAVPLPGGGNVPDLVSSLGFAFEEFGSISGAESADYAGRGPIATVFVGDPPPQRLVGQGLRVDVLPVAVVSPCELNIPTIERSLISGADVVIAAIGGLIGGPGTGVIVGRASAIDSLRRHRLSSLFKADLAATAMTLAALTRDPIDVLDSAVSRMSITVENLQSRAQRMATRLAGSDESIRTRITQEPALIASGMFPLASRQLVISIEGKSGQWIAEKLRGNEPSVLASSNDDEAIIDLRWMSPSQDASVVFK